MYPLLIFTSLHAEFNDVTFYVSCLHSAGYVAVILVGAFLLVFGFFFFNKDILKELPQYKKSKFQDPV